MIAANPNPFVAALASKLSTYSTQMGGTPEVMSLPGGFYCFLQGGPNNYVNPNAAGQIDSLVGRTADGLLTLVPQSVSQLYGNILGGTAWVISSADLATIQKESLSASAQLGSVISTWEASYGTVTAAQMTSADPPTKIGYITGQVIAKWGDATKIPPALGAFRVAYQAYQTAAAQSYTLLSQASAASLELAVAKGNATTPTAANGGLQTDTATWAAGYSFPAQTQIDNGLNTPGNAISITASASSYTSSSTTVSVEGGAGVTIPILDLLDIKIGGAASFDWSKAVSASSSMSMTVTFPGVTPVGLSPKALVGSNGWLDLGILQGIVANDGKGASVTGYQLQGGAYKASDLFGPDKRFGYLKSVLISQAPTISVTFTQANVSAFSSAFSAKASASVTLFGILPLGHVSGSYEVSNVSVNAAAQTVTITFGPSTVVGIGADTQAVAYAVAGVAAWPPGAMLAAGAAPHALAEFAAMGGDYPAYQCLKTKARDVYCSKNTVASHAEGNQWVKGCMAQYGLAAADLLSVYLADSQPSGATIW